MRQFLLVLAIELLFVSIYVYGIERVWQSRGFAISSASVYFVLFFELVAINGKMGLVSAYLKQLEVYLASIGQVGVIWETKALGAIIFPLGNSFTLPAALAVLVLVGQTVFIGFCQVRHFTSSFGVQVAVTAVIALLLFGLAVKTLTVDFNRKLPSIF